jgi:iron complex outermembrane receptor protein
MAQHPLAPTTMKNRSSLPPNAFYALLLTIALSIVSPTTTTGQTPSAADQAKSGIPEEPVMLSPFIVSTEKDTGYRATNSISGTRLDTAIKDTPMPIEVITRKFIDDTGATDLRTALKYSAGVLLQSQNDLSNSGANAYQGPGGVNNPEGATANPNAVQIKLRGFVTDNALRDGFIRQNSTDSVNVERVEVVRGPVALLYGTGNFGGVVNYLAKRPQSKAFSSFDVSYGSYNLERGQFDVTGPIDADKKVLFRVTGALQSTNDQTNYFKEGHSFISPALLWKPTPTTEIYVDAEYGKQKIKGLGARRLRSVADVGINNDQNEHGGLYTPPGADPRTYRVTGPDTYLNSTASNIEVKLTQELFKDVNFLVGYNYSTYDSQNRDVQAQLFTNVGPASLRQTITLHPISTRGDGSLNIQNGVVPNSILQYTWSRFEPDNTRKQIRTEFTAKRTLFEHNSKWLKIENQLLAGYSEINNKITNESFVTTPGGFNYKAPTDLTPLRFGIQGDGTADRPMYRNNVGASESWNKAFYASYQGRFLDNRLLILLGARRDTNDAANSNVGLTAPGATPTTSGARGDSQRQQTYQRGVSFQLTPQVSVYALKSEGLQPNFSGQVLPDTGAPAGASLARSEEIGLKFDLLDGRISGTVSKYKIRKTGFVGAPWYSPVTLGKPNFNPNKDIVYNVSNFSPTQAPGGSNGGSTKLDTGATYAAWQAGVASGAIFKSSAGNGSPTWYVNASQPNGAAYLDAAFAANDADNGSAWPGFLYQGESGDSLVNNATMDTLAFHGSGSGNAALLLTDESKGYDAQLLFKATKNLEFVASGAITEVRRLNFGQWMKYPYQQDRWPVWNFNNGSWGTLGLPRPTVYTSPGSATAGPDTSTRTGVGQAAGDDTPKYHADLWMDYTFDGSLTGLSAGLGGYWESKRQYMSGVTHGSGQLILDGAGQLLVLYTTERVNFDAMVRYEWKSSRGYHQYLQLNIVNLLNDEKLYGLIYSNPLNAKLTYGMRF